MELKMKLMIVIGMVCLNVNLAAASDSKDDNKWMERRDKKVTHLESKISRLQAHKNCFSGASTKEAFKKCHELLRADRKKWKAKREERKKNRQKKN